MTLSSKNKKKKIETTPSKLTTQFHAGQLYVLPCGGCGEFGMNLTAYVYNRMLFIIDAGTIFPPAEFLGIQSDVEALIASPDLYRGILVIDNRLRNYLKHIVGKPEELYRI